MQLLFSIRKQEAQTFEAKMLKKTISLRPNSGRSHEEKLSVLQAFEYRLWPIWKMSEQTFHFVSDMKNNAVYINFTLVIRIGEFVKD